MNIALDCGKRSYTFLLFRVLTSFFKIIKKKFSSDLNYFQVNSTHYTHKNHNEEEMNKLFCSTAFEPSAISSYERKIKSVRNSGYSK